MDRFSGLFIFLAVSLFSAVAARADNNDGDISVEQMLRQFDDVVFGSEHGVASTIVRRWTEAPSVGLFVSPDFEGAPPFERIREVLDEIGHITGLGPTQPRAPEEATLRLGFFPRRDFAALPAAQDVDRAEYERFVGTSACLGIAGASAEAPGALQAGLVLIGSDIPPALQSHCILEELVQVMGLPNDACNYQPSLFCEEDHVPALTAADGILLRALYDPRLQAGMPRDAALIAAETVIRDLLRDLP